MSDLADIVLIANRVKVLLRTVDNFQGEEAKV